MIDPLRFPSLGMKTLHKDLPLKSITNPYMLPPDIDKYQVGPTQAIQQLMQIFLPKFPCIIKLIIITRKARLCLSSQNSGLSGTHLYKDKGFFNCQ